MGESLHELQDERAVLLAMLGNGEELVYLDIKPGPLTNGERENLETRLDAVGRGIQFLKHESNFGDDGRVSIFR